MPEHDVFPGKLERCQITGGNDLFEAIDLGFQPSAGALLSEKNLYEPEIYYPLRLMISPSSGLGQLDYVVDNEMLFSNTDYVYQTGISQPLCDHLESLVDKVVSNVKLPKNSFCVDVGSNDGTLLRFLKSRGMQTLGVEPTNMAVLAREENGIETIQSFFDEKTAKKVADEKGKADLITFTNVFAHMSSLGEVMRGLVGLLNENGVVVSESQYLLDIFERNQFDQIYHEHIRIYSLKSLVKLFSYYGMEVFYAERTHTREGSICVYAGWKGQHKIDSSVQYLVNAEENAGLFSEEGWAGFRQRVDLSKQRTVELAHQARKKGELFVADSCPTRGVVVMNYYGLDKTLVPYISQLPKTEKIGRYMAGTHNPIVENDIILKDNPDYILILAWHFADFIIDNWRKKGVKSTFVVPFPDFKVIKYHSTPKYQLIS